METQGKEAVVLAKRALAAIYLSSLASADHPRDSYASEYAYTVAALRLLAAALRYTAAAMRFARGEDAPPSASVEYLDAALWANAAFRAVRGDADVRLPFDYEAYRGHAQSCEDFATEVLDRHGLSNHDYVMASFAVEAFLERDDHLRTLRQNVREIRNEVAEVLVRLDAINFNRGEE
jgi:hypothetical protein